YVSLHCLFIFQKIPITHLCEFYVNTTIKLYIYIYIYIHVIIFLFPLVTLASNNFIIFLL
ncbi:MAG: hypothetical protein MCS20_02165, partial [Candidatus Phytoplasma mali]|nr:hypothetical protein [Candidatus Phytoplasma australiense]MCG7202194.1 hypothetical protein [Candidatus Phytoplasma mali]